MCHNTHSVTEWRRYILNWPWKTPKDPYVQFYKSVKRKPLIQAAEVLSRRIPRLCQYFRVRVSIVETPGITIKLSAAAKYIQHIIGKDRRSKPPLYEHTSQRLFQVYLIRAELECCTTYCKILQRIIVIFSSAILFCTSCNCKSSKMVIVQKD